LTLDVVRPRRPGTVTAVWVVLAVIVSGGLLVWRFQEPQRIMSSGDSYFYMRQALRFTGVSGPVATQTSINAICADINRVNRQTGNPVVCKSYNVKGISPRYVQIFASRPGYPLFAAPFVAVLGAWPGMFTATVVLDLITVVLAVLAVYLATGYRVAGFAAAIALIALPSGLFLTRMLTECALLAGYLALIIGALLAWRGRFRAGLTIAGVALAWLFAVKSASGMAAALALVGASGIALIGPRELTGSRERWRGPLLTGGLGLALLVVWAGFAALTHQPGLYVTIQDFATRHFKKPDIADPYGWLYRKNRAYWPQQIRALLAAPVPLLSFLAATALLFLRARREAALFVLIGLIGVAMQVAHPYPSQWDRMNVSLWLTVAAAVGLAVGWAGDQLRKGSPSSGALGSTST
jgi:hypothetical protein